MNTVGLPRMWVRKTGPYRSLRSWMKPNTSRMKLSVSPSSGRPALPGGNFFVSLAFTIPSRKIPPSRAGRRVLMYPVAAHLWRGQEREGRAGGREVPVHAIAGASSYEVRPADDPH